MGTRSLTHIHDEAGATLLTLYKQHDGYPEGWGKELAEFLTGFRIVNGLSGDDGKIANGMGCLAAQLIAHFKDEPGQFYIYPADSKDEGEEFVYHVNQGESAQICEGQWSRRAYGLTLSCQEVGGAMLFHGAPQAYPAFLKSLTAERN